MEEHIISGTMAIIFFLITAVFSSIFLKKINFPYTIGLVIIGIIFGILAFHWEFLTFIKTIELSPDLILYIILPTLIFDAAIDIDSAMLKKNIVPILLLAIFGLLISTGVIGVGLSFLTPLSMIGALVFGALISATDPVAVVALFREIGAPKRLMTIVDGESLFNDATAIVLFTILISPFVNEVAESVTFIGAMGKFTLVLVGGLAVGTIIGFVGSIALSIEKNNLLLQITVSLLMAYISFIVADHFLKVSGVMSTLAAGLVFRSRAESVIKLSNMETVEHFWDYFTFVANSFVFLLLGLTEVHLMRNSGNATQIFIGLLCVVPTILIARASGIYLLLPLYNKFSKKSSFPVPTSYQTVIFWGGLRGAVPVALVLAIPVSFPNRELIIHYTMGFILFTLLVQGTSIKKLMDKLNIKPDKSAFDDCETLTRDFTFGSEKLAALILNGMKKMFEDEGFFIREQRGLDFTELLMKRGKVTLIVNHTDKDLSMTSEPQNISYLNRVLYETLLELKSSIDSLKDASNPENIQKIVATEMTTMINDFDIMKFIKPELITANLVSTEKNELLKEMVTVLYQQNIIADYEQVFEEILIREKSMSTGMGMGIAMPHARTETVSKLTALIGVSVDGIDFNAIDGKDVNIFVMVLSPKSDSGPHLQFLATISKILINPKTCRDMIDATTASEIYRIIEEGARIS